MLNERCPGQVETTEASRSCSLSCQCIVKSTMMYHDVPWFNGLLICPRSPWRSCNTSSWHVIAKALMPRRPGSQRVAEGPSTMLLCFWLNLRMYQIVSIHHFKCIISIIHSMYPAQSFNHDESIMVLSHPHEASEYICDFVFDEPRTSLFSSYG